MAEEGRISVRSARRDANETVKERMKEGEISEDEGHRQLDQIQKLTDECVGKIDTLLEAKEKEVLEI
jgi:ribosome recycling factor